MLHSMNNFLLASKFMWRQGYVRCPDGCDMEKVLAGEEKCECYCPTEIIGGMSPWEILNRTGVIGLFEALSDIQGIDDPESHETWSTLVHMLCHVGHAGD